MDPTTAPSTTDPLPHAALPAWHPLADRLRWVKVAVLFLLLIAAAAYLGYAADRDTLYVDEMLEDPDAHHGADVYLGQFRVRGLDDGVAELWSPWVQLPAHPVPDGVAVGDAVSITGTFQRDGTVRADRWQIHELLWVKKLVGIAVTLSVAGAIGVVWWRGRRRA